MNAKQALRAASKHIEEQEELIQEQARLLNLYKADVKNRYNGLDPLNPFGTVGVKLTVVPWEQVTSRRLIYKGGHL